MTNVRIETKPTVVGLSPGEVVEYFGELQDGTQFIIYRPRGWHGYEDFRCLLRPPEYDTFKLEPIREVSRMRDGGTTRIALSTGSFLFPSPFRMEEPTFNDQPLTRFAQ